MDRSRASTEAVPARRRRAPVLSAADGSTPTAATDDGGLGAGAFDDAIPDVGDAAPSHGELSVSALGHSALGHIHVGHSGGAPGSATPGSAGPGSGGGPGGGWRAVA